MNTIDKTSSEELHEAIHSIHGWYGDASVCYASLAGLLFTLFGKASGEVWYSPLLDAELK